MKTILTWTAACISLLALFQAPVHAAATDSARVAGDLKVDGIHFSSDGSVQTKANPWNNGDPDIAGNIGFMQGNVGIGTLTPSEQLELTGNLKLPATTATAGQIRQGGYTLLHTLGNDNFFAGINAGNLTVSGSLNTAVGSNALHTNTTGAANTASGAQALYANNGYNNTANGVRAMYNNTTGMSNTANGTLALYSNTTGDCNTAIGDSSGVILTTGSYNTFVGTYSDASASNLTNATAVGYNAKVNASNKVRIGNALVTVIEGQVAMTTPSDIRLKNDVIDVTHGLDFIKQLRPVEYRMKQGNDRKDFGFIAQEVEALLGTEYNVLGIGEDSERTLSLRYTDFIAPLVKAVQEQQVVIGTQQVAISTQQTTIDQMKAELAEIRKLLGR